MKIGFVSLGCPKNLVDTEVMMGQLVASGHELTPDPSGAISGQLTVHRLIDGPNGRVDCASAPGACDLVAATQNAVILARHALGFDPTAPPPASQVTVAPSTGLLNNQTVTVFGSGFLPGDRVYVRECATVDPFCSGSTTVVQADSGGGFSTSFNVRLRVGDGSGGATHCLVVDCIVRAESQTDQEYVADAPITFDPTQPVPALPAIQVTPATGLVHDQLVTITGTGFDPNSYIEISECDSTTGS